MANGMKSGSGDDPFADDDVGGTDTDTDAGDDQDSSGEPAATDPVTSDPFDEAATTDDPEPETPDAMPGIPDHPADADSQLPWIHRRDGVKDDRSHKTIHYTEHTMKRERRELQLALEDRLGEDVELTDVREAAYLVGMDHVDDVADVLREWGYSIE